MGLGDTCMYSHSKGNSDARTCMSRTVTISISRFWWANCAIPFPRFVDHITYHYSTPHQPRCPGICCHGRYARTYRRTQPQGSVQGCTCTVLYYRRMVPAPRCTGVRKVPTLYSNKRRQGSTNAVQTPAWLYPYSGFHTDRPVVHLQRPADCEIQERSSQLSRKTNLEILVILQNLLL